MERSRKTGWAQMLLPIATALVGVLAGALLGGGRTAGRAQRSAHIPRHQRATIQEGEPRKRRQLEAASAASAATERHATGRVLNVVGSSGEVGARQAKEGTGCVQVSAGDISGERTLWLNARDMEGREIRLAAKVAHGRDASWNLSAGDYSLYWQSDDGMRYSARARVDEGRYTRLVLSDEERDGGCDVLRGLGTLDVTIAVPPGVPCSCVRVEVQGKSFMGADSVSRHTDAKGVCRFYLVPALYEVVVGRRRTSVTVTGGNVVSVRFAHETEGAVVFDHADGAEYRLSSVAPGRRSPRIVVSHDEHASALLFIEPGEYEVIQKLGSSRRPLGRVRVISGSASRAVTPTGGGRLRVYLARSSEGIAILGSQRGLRKWRFPSFKVTLEDVPEGDHYEARAVRTMPAGEFRDKSGVWVAEFVGLAGDYELRVSADGFRDAVRSVSVDGQERDLFLAVIWEGQG